MFALYEALISQIKKDEVTQYNLKHQDYLKRKQEKQNGPINEQPPKKRVRERAFKPNFKTVQPERTVQREPERIKTVQKDKIVKVAERVLIQNQQTAYETHRRSTKVMESLEEEPQITFQTPSFVPPPERAIRPAAAQPSQNPPEEEDDGQRVQCTEGCGRMFAKRALEKHIKICKKVFQAKRKQFQLKKDPEIQKAKAIADKKHQPQPRKEQGIPKWQKQSQIFRLNLKRAKGGLTPQEEKLLKECEADERKQCQTCGKKFDEKAYQRHRVFCANKAKQTKR